MYNKVSGSAIGIPGISRISWHMRTNADRLNRRLVPGPAGPLYSIGYSVAVGYPQAQFIYRIAEKEIEPCRMMRR